MLGKGSRPTNYCDAERHDTYSHARAWKREIVPAIVIGGITGSFFGYSHGKERAFKLKLAVQVALCQVQIEKNTKHGNFFIGELIFLK